MDLDVYEINRSYLLKAREVALVHGDQKAQFIMGVSPELAAALRGISIHQINALSRSNMTWFNLRVSSSLVRQIDAMSLDGELDEFGRCQVLESVLRKTPDVD